MAVTVVLVITLPNMMAETITIASEKEIVLVEMW